MDDRRRRQSTVEWVAVFAVAAVVLAVVTGEPLVAVGLAAWAGVLLIARLYLLGLGLPTWAAVAVHVAVPVLGVGGLWLLVSLSK